MTSKKLGILILIIFSCIFSSAQDVVKTVTGTHDCGTGADALNTGLNVFAGRDGAKLINGRIIACANKTAVLKADNSMQPVFSK